MKPRICPHCNRRNFIDNPNCSFCNKPLDEAPGQATTKAPPSPISPAPTPTPTSHRGGPLPPAPLPSPSPMPVPVPPPATPMGPSPPGTTPPAPPGPYGTPIPVPSTPGGGWSQPDLEGVVVDTREISVEAPKDWAGGIMRNCLALVLLPFRPLMVIASLIFGGRKPTEYRTVYVLRVQRLDGTVCQARIEREIAGATLDLGDQVSIWGDQRGGVFIVDRAFNHTVGAEVRLKQDLGPVASLIILAVLTLVVIFACIALYNFWSGI